MLPALSPSSSAVADLDRIAAAGEQQAQFARVSGQVGHCPARVLERDHRAEPRPAVEILDAGLEPAAVIDPDHRAGLVVLRGVRTADAHRQIEVAADCSPYRWPLSRMYPYPVMRQKSVPASAVTTSAPACSDHWAGSFSHCTRPPGKCVQVPGIYQPPETGGRHEAQAADPVRPSPGSAAAAPKKLPNRCCLSMTQLPRPVSAELPHSCPYLLRAADQPVRDKDAAAGRARPSAVLKRICWSGRGRSPFQTRAAVAVSGCLRARSRWDPPSWRTHPPPHSSRADARRTAAAQHGNHASLRLVQPH